jgi:hypothetical protein
MVATVIGLEGAGRLFKHVLMAHLRLRSNSKLIPHQRLPLEASTAEKVSFGIFYAAARIRQSEVD